ncbi:MAG TPA: hypothetical protein VGG89_05250 [Candidatus Baltobacteraceae bacterium]|jgi:hypothetical protein
MGYLLFCCACAGTSLTDKNGANGEDYLKSTLPRVMGTWSAIDLDKEASPELYKATPRTRMEWMLGIFRRKLGPLKSFTVANWNVNAGWYPQTGPITTEDYGLNARFQKGPGTIEIVIAHQRGAWKISGFNINSDELLK